MNQRMIVQISHPLSKTNLQIQKNMYQKLCVGDMWVSGTCGCGGHVGEGDMRVSETCGCRGHEGVGDLCSGELVCLILIFCLIYKNPLKPICKAQSTVIK